MKIYAPKAPHPLMAKRDQSSITAKLQAEMKASGLDALIVFRPENLFYVSGYYSKISDNVGCVGVNLAVVPASGATTLVVSTLELEAAMSLSANGVTVESYPSYVFIDNGTEENRRTPSPTEIDAFSGLRRAVEIVKGIPSLKRIGVEKPYLTLGMWEGLCQLLGAETLADSSPIFQAARRIKTPCEIDMLRLAAQHCERTMYRVADEVKSGMLACEIDRLMLKYAIEEDQFCTVGRNMFAGQAVGPYFGLTGIQRGYQVKKGDIVRFDGGFRHLGYVSDLARCFAVDDAPEPQAERIFATLVESFHRGIALLKPGTPMKEIYRTMVDSVTSSDCIPFYPRGHMGHSIGMNPGLEEWPQISPSMEEVLLPNMVVCVEAPIWTNGMSEHYGAFSIEDTFLITETGCERFTYSNESLIWH